VFEPLQYGGFTRHQRRTDFQGGWVTESPPLSNSQPVPKDWELSLNCELSLTVVWLGLQKCPVCNSLFETIVTRRGDPPSR
jgi:hypothetical protein